MEKQIKKIALIGGGPASLYLFQELVNAEVKMLHIEIFESTGELGSGMPYSSRGALPEHVTNVSSNEIPDLPETLIAWMESQSSDYLNSFNIEKDSLSAYKVVPRLLFGKYLNEQYERLIRQAKAAGWVVNVHLNTRIDDIDFDKAADLVNLIMSDGSSLGFEYAVICTGHIWPSSLETKFKGCFDSPYPPAKLQVHANYPVALKGASLTAVDAMRTLARQHGTFVGIGSMMSYVLNDNAPDFRMVLHSIQGLLPALRFHLEQSNIGRGKLLDEKEIEEQRSLNDGFLPLDYVFDKAFRIPLQKHDSAFFENMNFSTMEEFVALVMERRERVDPFNLLEAEYSEAQKSIKRKSSIYWKEMLGTLSFVMNYPAKYFSAEDMLRLTKELKPLISIVIAYLPQSSADEMLALYKAGVLEVKAVDESSKIEPQKTGGVLYRYNDNEVVHFEMFVDCIGQPPRNYEDFPFRSLCEHKIVSPAMVRFRNPENAQGLLTEHPQQVSQSNHATYLKVPGLKINDNFQVLDDFGAFNERIFLMAVPYIAGYNPDYSGLDFCEEAAHRIVKSMVL